MPKRCSRIDLTAESDSPSPTRRRRVLIRRSTRNYAVSDDDDTSNDASPHDHSSSSDDDDSWLVNDDDDVIVSASDSDHSDAVESVNSDDDDDDDDDDIPISSNDAGRHHMLYSPECCRRTVAFYVESALHTIMSNEHARSVFTRVVDLRPYTPRAVNVDTERSVDKARACAHTRTIIDMADCFVRRVRNNRPDTVEHVVELMCKIDVVAAVRELNGACWPAVDEWLHEFARSSVIERAPSGNPFLDRYIQPMLRSMTQSRQMGSEQRDRIDSLRVDPHRFARFMRILVDNNARIAYFVTDDDTNEPASALDNPRATVCTRLEAFVDAGSPAIRNPVIYNGIIHERIQVNFDDGRVEGPLDQLLATLSCDLCQAWIDPHDMNKQPVSLDAYVHIDLTRVHSPDDRAMFVALTKKNLCTFVERSSVYNRQSHAVMQTCWRCTLRLQAVSRAIRTLRSIVDLPTLRLAPGVPRAYADAIVRVFTCELISACVDDERLS